MVPVYFKDQFEFRKWLEENHLTVKELIVGFYKVGSSKYNMSWSESVDQALCYGWIDGIRRSVDEESYCIRFTPRKKSSIWSRINIEKVERLKELGLMNQAGLIAYSFRTDEKSEIYSFEKEHQSLPEDFENRFKSNPKAWEYFFNLAPSYKKSTINWILSAKQKKTQESRLEKTIIASENQNRIW
jgi:uncharacterized protein YdeI (YjbR/CyaY-like superfamily)